MKRNEFIRYKNLLSNISNWWLHFSVKLGITDKDPLVFRTRGDILIEVPIKLLHEFKESFMDEHYVRGGIKFGSNRHESRRPVVLDIGANIGVFSLFIASKLPNARIFSYEPIPFNYKQLVKNIELNKGVDIKPFRFAVSNISGEIHLSLEASDDFTTSASHKRAFDSHHEDIAVKSTTLPEIFETHKLEYCDFLKLDCEGSEFDILYGSPPQYLRRIKQMGIEVHPLNDSNHTLQSLAAYLNENGFATNSRGNILSAVKKE